MLEYIALILLITVALIIFYGIIVIHDIPYEIAVKRNHPHQDVLHVAGWVSLFTLHAIWPFLWIWAMLYDEGRGWGVDNSSSLKNTKGSNTSVDVDIIDRLTALEAKLTNLETGEGE